MHCEYILDVSLNSGNPVAITEISMGVPFHPDCPVSIMMVNLPPVVMPDLVSEAVRIVTEAV